MKRNPDRIGPYKVLRQIGQGGQGVVYLAEDPRLGRRVALKVLTTVPGLSSKAAQRFRREAEITAQLDHPGICTIYDFGEEEGVPWIAMRYVEGATLSSLIAVARDPTSAATTAEYESLAPDSPRREPEPASFTTTSRTREEIAWVVRVIEKAARALHAAHEGGVIHRDIKPANIMVGPDETTVILDFGLASALQSDGPTLTLTGDLMGTPHYMAPEQLTRATIPLDRRADVHALGVTLYEALTLARPFDSPTRERLYQAILAKDPPDPHRLNPAISRDLSAVVATALEKDRDRRYKTALDFAEDLRRTLAREPVLARRAGPVGRLMKWASRHPGVALSTATLLVVLVAGLAVTSVLLGRTNEALGEVERLSDVKRVRDLEEEASRLFPASPEMASAMTGWLARARSLLSRLPGHEEALAALDAPAEGRVSRIEDAWRRDVLTELVGQLRAFGDPDPRVGTVADVADRLAFAQSVTRRTVDDFADRWKGAIQSIADTAVCPKYAGLRISPQSGLVPLGRNRDTGLWEFGHLQSGEPPGTNGLDATCYLEPACGIVLVLLPKGVFRMGSPSGEFSRSEDEAINEVVVDAFFVGKHEVTQAQWDRVVGKNPSLHLPQNHPTITPLNPVEQMSWFDADAFARRLGLSLLTEVRWEYACRAGTTTAYAFCDDLNELDGRINVRDVALRTAEGEKASMIESAPWDDGFPYHGRVDALAPNLFGLFGMHGNVEEWCLDWYGDVVVKDGIRQPVAKGREKCARGGSWLMPPRTARSAARHRFQPVNRSPAIGLRVCRDLVP